MCLNVNSHSLPRITLFNKVVYKVLVKPAEDGQYYTPFQHSKIRMGKSYEAELYRVADQIEDGLHSFKELKDAQKFKQSLASRFKVVIAKCIIPRFTKYYFGDFFYYSNGYKGYASARLTYVEEIID